jgi:hypothetical protein
MLTLTPKATITGLRQGTKRPSSTLLHSLLNPPSNLLRRRPVRNMPAVHPLVDLAVLAPIVRIAADLQHLLAIDVLEFVLAVERVAESDDGCDLAAGDRVLALF